MVVFDHMNTYHIQAELPSREWVNHLLVKKNYGLLTLSLGPIVQRMDKAIQQIDSTKTYLAIHWIPLSIIWATGARLLIIFTSQWYDGVKDNYEKNSFWNDLQNRVFKMQTTILHLSKILWHMIVENQWNDFNQFPNTTNIYDHLL